MKKFFLISAFVIALFSCNNSGDNGTTTNDTVPNPNSASDKTHQPDGMTNGSVTSTDTGAMNMNKQNAKDTAK